MDKTWHTRSYEEIISSLGSSDTGLSEEEAQRRLVEYGENKLPETKVDHVLVIFLRQFESPLIYILLAAAFVVFLMGEAVDSIVIATVLILNAIVGAIQEGRARNTILALKKFVETKAVALRSSSEVVIPDTQVVRGDIIIVTEGDRIPADARIISAHNLKVDEAALTGESEAVHKTSDTLANPALPDLEKKNMLFKGTHAVSGNARAVVVGTGLDTAIGKIAKEVAAIDTEIPLKANIRHLSRMIIGTTFFVSSFLLIFGIMSGKPIREMFATVISISVSVIPEGLPIAITVILATGVWRMSKQQALVKRLQAVEALGQARVIAVDKTGTLTKNEMMVETIYVDGKFFEVGGVGYEPKGEIKHNEKVIEPPNHPELMLVGKMAAFCANARTAFIAKENVWKTSGDPTEAALYVLAEKLGFKKDDLEEESPPLSEIPFNYSNKYHATLHKDKGREFLTVVGAPEVVLGLSHKIWHNGEEIELHPRQREELVRIFSDISRDGLRILGLAMRIHDPGDLREENIRNLSFVGFLGLKDALRPEVKAAAELAVASGIKVIMITGDHKITAEAIAREAGIYGKHSTIITGNELDNMSDIELAHRLGSVSVFARVTPEHKLRIIKAYKSNGDIVSMTGDGVNDAPSLVAADLGVAMGKVGTEVAKEASDIVLLDDNFGSIVSAIEEGRSIYKTIKKVVLYLLSTSIGEILVIGGAIIAGLPLPLLPAQIIWLNFVTDGFFTVALAMEPREKGLLLSTFERPKKYLVDALMGIRMILMALPMMLVTLFLFQSYFEINLEKTWTISLTILAVFQWFNAWNCRSEKESIFTVNPLKNIYMVGATVLAFLFQLLAVYHPLFQKFLRTVPLEVSDWLVIITLATTIIWVEEARKFLARRTLPQAITLKPVLNQS